MIPKINLEDRFDEIDKPWSPVDLAKINDCVIRMVLVHGEYNWHKHVNEDELFYVYRGKIQIQVKGHQDITLNANEMALIPRGVEHCPKSQEPSYVLLFVPQSTQHRW